MINKLGREIEFQITKEKVLTNGEDNGIEDTCNTCKYRQFSNKGTPPNRGAPPLFSVGPLDKKNRRFWLYLSQEWSDFHSVKSLWKQGMSSKRPFPCIHALSLY